MANSFFGLPLGGTGLDYQSGIPQASTDQGMLGSLMALMGGQGGASMGGMPGAMPPMPQMASGVDQGMFGRPMNKMGMGAMNRFQPFGGMGQMGGGGNPLQSILGMLGRSTSGQGMNEGMMGPRAL